MNEEALFHCRWFTGCFGCSERILGIPRHSSLAAGTADKHMKGMGSVDALIVDLRRNGGGDPAMVQYLCSYFFSQGVHLNSIYSRTLNTTAEYWTIPVAGKKLPDVPLFVLTSGFTFSGGEEFAYDMQTQKRAIVIDC